METPTLGAMAWTLTSEALPAFLERLHTRPEPHNLEYTGLLIELAAETLNRKPFSIFREYSDLTGERHPEIAKRLWDLSYPGSVLDFKRKAEPEMGIVIDFPADRIRKSISGAR